MRTKDKIDYRSKLQDHDKSYFSQAETNYKPIENQQFIVPWQMIIKKEKEFLIK